jgi:hypothetical protein
MSNPRKYAGCRRKQQSYSFRASRGLLNDKLVFI